jgi:hypothetical protein
MDKRYFNNDAEISTHQLRVEDPQGLLIQSLIIIVQGCPPVLPWVAKFRGQTYRGLFLGPTSIAYLFLWLSKVQPSLILMAGCLKNGATHPRLWPGLRCADA